MKAPVEASRSNITAKRSRYQHRRSWHRQIDTPCKKFAWLAAGQAGPCGLCWFARTAIDRRALPALDTNGGRGELKILAGPIKALARQEPSS
jgi:hypothetical protein